MRCPACLKDDAPHTVRSLKGKGTRVQLSEGYWDENDNYVYASYVTQYACSFGHTWEVTGT